MKNASYSLGNCPFVLTSSLAQASTAGRDGAIWKWSSLFLLPLLALILISSKPLEFSARAKKIA